MYTVLHLDRRVITLKGRPLNIILELAVRPTDFVLSDAIPDFGPKDVNLEYYQRFQNGELEQVNVRVRAIWRGLEGATELIGAHVLTSRISEASLNLASTYDLWDAALSDLMSEIQSVQLSA